MIRGAVTKQRAKLLTVWVPLIMTPYMDLAVRRLDLDKSKFVRIAIREKLLRAGVRVPEEVL